MRRFAMGGAAVLVAFAVLFGPAASPAAANPIGLIGVVPEVAASGGVICAGTAGIGCVAVGVGLLAIGAWYAYNNWDQIINGTVDTMGDGQQQAAPTGASWTPGANYAWTGYVPDPAAGPFDAYNTCTVVGAGSGCASGELFRAKCMVDWCQPNPTNGANAWTIWCLNTYTGTLSAASYNDFRGALQGTGNSVANNWTRFSGPTVPCSVPGSAVAQVIFNGVLTWTASGDWQRQRRYQSTVTCRYPNGTTTTVSQSGSYYSADGGVTATIPACPDGSVAVAIKVDDCIQGGACQPYIDWSVNPTAPTDYPSCFSGSPCSLSIKYQGTTCVESLTACQEWYKRSREGTPGYECYWGPYKVPLSNCLPLRWSYWPGAVPDPDTGLAVPGDGSNPSATPGATPLPQPSSTASVQAWPTTGTNPFPSPTYTGAGPAPYDPNPAPTVAPTAPVDPAPDPLPDPGGDESCMAGVWSWNPLDWVLTPVKCALQWAFVPDATRAAASVQSMQTAWDTSGPGVFMGAAFDAAAPLGDLGDAGASTCGGVHVTIPLDGLPVDFSMLDACEPPWDTWAPWLRGFLTAIVVGSGTLAGIRILGSGLGWNFTMRSGGAE